MDSVHVDIVEKAKKHLRQMAPHVATRESACIIRGLLSKIESLGRPTDPVAERLRARVDRHKDCIGSDFEDCSDGVVAVWIDNMGNVMFGKKVGMAIYQVQGCTMAKSMPSLTDARNYRMHHLVSPAAS